MRGCFGARPPVGRGDSGPSRSVTVPPFPGTPPGPEPARRRPRLAPRCVHRFRRGPDAPSDHAFSDDVPRPMAEP